MQQEGEQLINVLFIGRPCNECLRDDKPWLCPHQLLPPWKSSQRQQRYSKVLYAGRQDQNLREQFAVITECGQRQFDDEDIDALATAAPHVTNRSPDFIYLLVDPAEGGESDFGVTMCFWDGPLFVVSVFISFFLPPPL